MRDRTGQVWNDGDATFVVLGAPELGDGGVLKHPVLVIGSAKGWFDVGKSDRWPEDVSWRWERQLERVS